MSYDSVSEIDIAAEPPAVWATLTDSTLLGRVMFGSTVESDWKVGSPITYSGEWEGKKFTDKGEIVELSEPTRLVMTHFSPASGEADSPENYHRITYDLAAADNGTHVTLTQDNNKSEEAAAHSRKNWDATLESLKKVVEEG